MALSSRCGGCFLKHDSYKQGVEYFNQSDFTAAGFANDTMAKLTEIYENENGHLAIFEAAIPAGVVSFSSHSIVLKADLVLSD